MAEALRLSSPTDSNGLFLNRAGVVQPVWMLMSVAGQVTFARPPLHDCQSWHVSLTEVPGTPHYNLLCQVTCSPALLGLLTKKNCDIQVTYSF